MDLTDEEARGRVTSALAERYVDRPVVLGPGILAAHTEVVSWVRERGGRALVVATARGAGPLPGEGECVVVEVEPPRTGNVTEELRALDRLARHLPAEAVAAIEAFDPARRAVWRAGPFVTTDEPILGRPVVSGRPAAFMALEDKLLADDIWDAADVERAPYAVVPVERAALAAATRELAGPLGAVWSGDARAGFNGGGNYVRWVGVDDVPGQAEAVAWYLTRCDRARVMPFLDGVPCSIHGLVLPDGTAALRPVEIAILRRPADRTFTSGGLSTFWDPPPADREAMRAATRRVGEHLRAAYGYRGAFGIDGVLTADGFRPTELNTRASAGFTLVTQVDREFFALLQDALVLGEDPGVGAADVEALLPMIDAVRTGRAMALGGGLLLGESAEESQSVTVTWDGARFERAPDGVGPEETGHAIVMADTPSGHFAKVQPCDALVRGVRLATVDLALHDFLDREHGTSFGALEAAPDLR